MDNSSPTQPTASPVADRPRVAVLTFHFHYNYGGVLQAYGLWQALRHLGYDAVFPSTIPGFCRGWVHPWAVLSPRRKGILQGLRAPLTEFPRRWAFDRFRRQDFPPAVAGPAWNEAIADPRLVAAIVGSDQVWNLAWMPTWEPYYFLGSLPEDSPVRRIAYAACFGTETQRADYLARAKALLDRFTAIGVRTETTRRIVETHSPIRTTTVVDPSLLHDFQELRGQRPFDGEYILVYGIRPKDFGRARDIACTLKQRTGRPIAVLVPESFTLEWRPAIDWADKVCEWASPADWVESIRQCNCLVTDSFHGVLFATAFRRPFLAYPQGTTAERIVDVTRRYGLSDRLVSGDAGESHVNAMFAPIDFDLVHERLRVDREASLRFLREALGGSAHRSINPRPDPGAPAG